MLMDGEQAYGCAQCGEDKITQLVRHFTQVEDVKRFLDPANERRILLMPEYIFFDRDVLNSLRDARNIAAIVVYEPLENDTGYPPITSLNLSTDLLEPNRPYNYYPQGYDPDEDPRNPIGRGTKFLLYPFNIFRINNNQSKEILGLLNRFPDVILPEGNTTDPEASAARPARATAPRYKLQSMGQMYACPELENGAETSISEVISTSVNSSKCLTDKTCLPVGGHSVWSALEHMDDRVSTGGRRKILAITAPMDSNAFFPDFALGASAEISSLAVMMVVAEAVGAVRRGTGKTSNMQYQPVYFAWNAQSWGYAGSSRFLNDVREFTCKTKDEKYDLINGCKDKYMNNLKFRLFKDADVIALNLGHMTVPNPKQSDQIPLPFFLHAERELDRQPEDLIPALLKAFEDNKPEDIAEFGLVLSSSNPYVPPLDATQSFRVYMPEAKVVSITAYDKEFNNLLYHSMYDNMSLVTDFERVALAARSIAAAVISIAFGNDLSVNLDSITEERIKEIIGCLSASVNGTSCQLADEYLYEEASNSFSTKVIPGNYPGSFFPDTRLQDTNKSAFYKLSLIRRFLAYHNRYATDEDVEECRSDEECEEFEKTMNGASDTSIYVRRALCAKRKCVASDTYTHNALGLALSSDNKDQTSFTYNFSAEDVPSQDASNAAEPQLNAGWTESVWDFDLGLCGFVEDTPLFGGLILGAGLAVLAVSFAAAFWLDRVLSQKKKKEGTPREMEPTGREPEESLNGNGQTETGIEVPPME